MGNDAPDRRGTAGLLEVIVTSLEEALEAERGGAGRLEIVSHLELGGFTPNFETVQKIFQHVAIPVRVMLRCSESHTPGLDAVRALSEQAEELGALAVDGLVLGFLRKDRVDVVATQRVLTGAPNLRATFHRAFDETADPLAEIRQLKEIRQIDRILTSGGDGPWETRVKRLQTYQQTAAPEITILVGGGLDRVGIERLRSETQVHEFHTGRAVRVPGDACGLVQAERVTELVACLHG
jgi:copper homeostasis protein